jgi:hypothetical protein
VHLHFSAEHPVERGRKGGGIRQFPHGDSLARGGQRGGVDRVEHQGERIVFTPDAGLCCTQGNVRFKAEKPYETASQKSGHGVGEV